MFIIFPGWSEMRGLGKVAQNYMGNQGVAAKSVRTTKQIHSNGGCLNNCDCPDPDANAVWVG